MGSRAAIVMVTYRKIEYARLVLGNLLPCLDELADLYVFDNDSGTQMLALLGQVATLGGKRVWVTGCRKNIGKANAVNSIVAEKNLLEKYEKLVMMDQDIIFLPADLQLLLRCLEDISNPGMISMDYYPWNSPKPKNAVSRTVAGKSNQRYDLSVRPESDISKDIGFVAGGVFGLTAETVQTRLNGKIYTDTPYVYYGEDAVLDLTLLRQGTINGYLQGTQALHLPELDQPYQDWKNKMRMASNPSTQGYYELAP